MFVMRCVCCLSLNVWLFGFVCVLNEFILHLCSVLHVAVYTYLIIFCLLQFCNGIIFFTSSLFLMCRVRHLVFMCFLILLLLVASIVHT